MVRRNRFYLSWADSMGSSVTLIGSRNIRGGQPALSRAVQRRQQQQQMHANEEIRRLVRELNSSRIAEEIEIGDDFESISSLLEDQQPHDAARNNQGRDNQHHNTAAADHGNEGGIEHPASSGNLHGSSSSSSSSSSSNNNNNNISSQPETEPSDKDPKYLRRAYVKAKRGVKRISHQVGRIIIVLLSEFGARYNAFTPMYYTGYYRHAYI